MQDITKKIWKEFPFELSKCVKKIIPLSERMIKIRSGVHDVWPWQRILAAATAVKKHGMAQMDELIAALADIPGSHEASWKLQNLEDILVRWANDPSMPAPPPQRERRTNSRMFGLRMPRGWKNSILKRIVHPAPVESRLAGYAWLGYRWHDLFWDARSVAIFHDPCTGGMSRLIEGDSNCRTFLLEYEYQMQIWMPDGTMPSLETIPDSSLEPVDVLIASCEKFNGNMELFTKIGNVHRMVQSLYRTGLIGSATKKFGVGYIGNKQYHPDYWQAEEYFLKCDFMLTEDGNDWDGYERQRNKLWQNMDLM